MPDFHDWITQKYIEWRGSAIGRERSISDFAEMIGVSQPLMSDWMKKGGKVPKHIKTINKLANIFGPEVYVVLKENPLTYLTSHFQMDIESPDLREFIEIYLSSDLDLQKAMLKSIKEMSEEYDPD